MRKETFYDVTKWRDGDPYVDIGYVLNSIISDIKRRKSESETIDTCGEGYAGAVIFLPPGDYPLKTQVRIDCSYLKIMGAGHGFISSSIRYNLPEADWSQLHEIWPGGSRIMVELPGKKENELDGAAFLIEREGDPRISSVEFANFCIDGLHFTDDTGEMENPENSYRNGKTGILVKSAQDSFRINEMGFVYLEHALTIYHADALSIHDNFIAECGNCIELRGWGQASKVTDNLIGAGFHGYSVYAENFGGLLITGNNIFPRGESVVRFCHVAKSNISANRFHAFYPGMLVFERQCCENLVSANHFLRDNEPWTPMREYNNKRDDDGGLLCISGSDNSLIGNHISYFCKRDMLRPLGCRPVIIYISDGESNYIAQNHIVARTENKRTKTSDACFASQVEALTSAKREDLEIIAVMIETGAERNIVLDTGRLDQLKLDPEKNIVRPLPAI